ncbi:MAG: ABC transporter substrate-binding protein [Candidatus Thorarchaeota archaeon]
MQHDYPISAATWTYPSGYNPHGGYVDRIWFFVFPSEDMDVALHSLQVGSVHTYDDSISNNSIYELSFNSAIEISSELGYAYRQFTLQCQRFPTNITGYRRALAYSLDKYRVVEKSTGGYATPQDTAIPLSNPLYACENLSNGLFYTQDIAAANASLEAAHFIDTPDSPHPGWRYYDTDMSGNWTLGDKRGDDHAPEGVKIELLVSAGFYPSIEAAQVQLEGMQKAGLMGEVIEVGSSISFGFHVILGTGEWNFCCFRWQLPPPGEPEFLYDFFHTSGSDNPFFYRYNNSEFDYNASQMMTAPTRIEVQNWVVNCCRILLEDMPMIVCYNEMTNHAVRTDIWEGYIAMEGLGYMGNNPYTYRNIRLKEDAGGPFGCVPTEFYAVLSEGMDFTNALLSDSQYADRIFMNVYSRLWAVDPYTWEKVPDLAWNWTIEQTVAAGDIQDGQKFTFYLYENVSWHDGMHFTSEDVQYSLDTIHRWGPYTARNIQHIYRIDTPEEHIVEIYSNQTGYIEFCQATYLYIFPKHIWQAAESGYFTWSPDTPEDLAGTGPFKWGAREVRQFILLNRFDDWHFAIEQPDTRTPCPPSGPPPLLYLIIAVAIVIIVIQVVVLFLLLNRRRTGIWSKK